MKRYIKASYHKAKPNVDSRELAWLHGKIDDMESAGEIDSDEAERLRNINWQIQAEDADFLMHYDPYNVLDGAKSVEYEVNESVDAGYDGAYLVTYDNGRSELYGWLDRDTLSGNPRLYQI